MWRQFGIRHAKITPTPIAVAQATLSAVSRFWRTISMSKSNVKRSARPRVSNINWIQIDSPSQCSLARIWHKQWTTEPSYREAPGYTNRRQSNPASSKLQSQQTNQHMRTAPWFEGSISDNYNSVTQLRCLPKNHAFAHQESSDLFFCQRVTATPDRLEVVRTRAVRSI